MSNDNEKLEKILNIDPKHLETKIFDPSMAIKDSTVTLARTSNGKLMPVWIFTRGVDEDVG